MNVISVDRNVIETKMILGDFRNLGIANIIGIIRKLAVMVNMILVLMTPLMMITKEVSDGK